MALACPIGVVLLWRCFAEDRSNIAPSPRAFSTVCTPISGMSETTHPSDLMGGQGQVPGTQIFGPFADMQQSRETIIARLGTPCQFSFSAQAKPDVVCHRGLSARPVEDRKENLGFWLVGRSASCLGKSPGQNLSRLRPWGSHLELGGLCIAIGEQVGYHRGSAQHDTDP
ncbi:hypothetical protein LY76DRAFT_383470 [Colletotrichum caudatum]|nr:hypothetical protein LY76DRAFT_383470 [Colletotrichum caudatum]